MLNLLKYKNREGEKGFTLIEAVISILILGIVVGSMLGVFMVSKVSITNAKYYIEAMNLLRHKMEKLKDTPYGNIASAEAQDISIDIGPDLVRGTDPTDPDDDDLWGTILVEVKDKEDLDEDNDDTETTIDVDGDEIDDPCKPIYVTISWTNPTWGGGTSVSEELATLISE